MADSEVHIEERLPVDLAALDESLQPPVNEPNVSALIPKPKPKPKLRCKTKAGASTEGAAADKDLALVRRSSQSKK